MAGDDRLTLEQMLDTVRRIRAMVRGRARKAFDADEVRQLALLHLIQVLGEAASRVSAAFREGHPEIPWSQMVGMRNRIVHGYNHVDPDIVWRVATEDLELALAALERMVEG
ncbi:MAG TPA: HepT-like ribonuclease domain-containing protein [Gemmatimonadales bacterium]|nr:HepT-like ribonuclease domain-containing protein [Gemmatimonadales bacterium]